MGTDRQGSYAAQIDELVNALAALCARRGVHREVVAERMGTKNATVYSFEGRQHDPKFATMLRYAGAIGARVHITVTTPDGAVSQETVTAPEESTQLWQVQAALAAVRKTQQRSLTQVARAMRRSLVRAQQIEEQGNLQLSTLLRYADVLGARLDFSVHLAPGASEKDPSSRDRPRPRAPIRFDSSVVATLRTRLESGALQAHHDRVGEVVDTLVAMRHERQLPRTVVWTRMGGNDSSVDRVEQRHRERKFTTIMRYAHAVGARVHIAVTTYDGTASPETATQPDDSTQLAQVQAALVATRQAQGLDHAHVAKALDCETKDVRRTEKRNDLLWSTLLRQAVALGARLDFAVHATPQLAAGRTAWAPTATGRLADQVAEDLMRRIDAGEWSPGAYLPTQTALRGEYDCAAEAIKDTLSTLRALGYVTYRLGDRTRVRDRSRDLDLPTALTELKSELGALRDGVGAQRLADLQRHLDEFAHVAQEQQERLLEPLTPEMRDKHAAPR